ncbi:MAG: hypothetical protein ACFFC6_15220 [Promethearchaeota archaeon]
MSQALDLFTLLLVGILAVLLITLIVASYYRAYIFFKYLYIKLLDSSNIDSDKNIPFLKKIQNALHGIIPLASEVAVCKFIKEEDLLNDNDKDKLRKLTILLYRVVVSLVIVILLLFFHTQR